MLGPHCFCPFCAHLCMKRSLEISHFLEEISSLSHSVVFLYFFALFTYEASLISPCYSLELCLQMEKFRHSYSKLVDSKDKSVRVWPFDLLENTGLPCSNGKEYACNAGDLGLVPGLGRSPGRGHGDPLQYSCLENPHGQRCLAGYSPWGYQELDITEQLSTAHSTWNSVQCYAAIWMEGSLRENEYMYMYGCVPSLFTWKHHSIVC